MSRTPVRPPTAPVRPPAGPRPAGTARRLAAPLGALAAAAAAFTAVALVDPGEPGHYPVCPLLHHTGLLCPGCGGLRGAHALAHGDLTTALHANALALAGYLVLAGYWLRWLRCAAAGRPAPAPRPGTVHLWIAAVLTVLFTVVRNLDAGAALTP
ncbi:DUF2752 domain-containing protein [Streptomyces pactum]|uniref:DUF2752 domain-containing protein n=1 Tax=Streptomyces pactum TaxID=68249 RepID=A0ABS0NGW8_9ACTN|nr:DUF2752 domain-containing protein [Streptomyces pactum]MBH5334354.1 DUF2752 domain-containing protein [Streptomyces pactum]